MAEWSERGEAVSSNGDERGRLAFLGTFGIGDSAATTGMHPVKKSRLILNTRKAENYTKKNQTIINHPRFD